MITVSDYNGPLGIPGGYFNSRSVPSFPDYLKEYHVHFMRYLYYLCLMNAEGEYPSEIPIDKIYDGFNNAKEIGKKRNIRKILIGEAPPPNSINYFYNPSHLRWNPVTGNPTSGQGWTSVIKNALFPGMVFPNTVSFLKECAKEGFLILDLFPYPISYSSRGSISRPNRIYSQACISAWGAGNVPYSHNMISKLNYLTTCIQNNIVFGFSLSVFGSIVLKDSGTLGVFDGWCLSNGITLNPFGPIQQVRVFPSQVQNASNLLRICHRRPMLTPCSVLMNEAGF